MGKKYHILNLCDSAKVRRISARRQKKMFQGTRKRGPILAFIEHDINDLVDDVLSSMSFVGAIESFSLGHRVATMREHDLVSTIGGFLAPELSTTRARPLFPLE